MDRDRDGDRDWDRNGDWDRDRGRDRGRGRGRVRGQGQEDDCADLKDLELKRGREGTLQHGPGAILEGAIGSCRDPTSFG